MKLSCRDCYYHGQCYSKRVCRYFEPITTLAEDEVIRIKIESEREEYRKAWAEYVRDFE